MCWLRALIVWLLLVGAEFIHGVLRNVILVPVVGDFRSRQIGVFTGSLIIVAIAFLLINWIGAKKTRTLLGIGLMWLMLMVAFEIGAGHFLFGYSWQRLFSDYNLFQGGLLPIGLAILMLSPVIAAKIRAVSSG